MNASYYRHYGVRLLGLRCKIFKWIWDINEVIDSPGPDLECWIHQPIMDQTPFQAAISTYHLFLFPTSPSFDNLTD